MIKAVIFDCFGVVITDGLELVTQRLSKTDPAARDFIVDTIRLSNGGLLEPEVSNQRIADHLGVSIEEWRGMVDVGEAKNTEVLQWIASLRHHYYKTALLSNVGSGSLQRRFDEGELERYFDVVVASGEVGLLKPDPQIYQLTAERLDVAPEDCAFLDDRESYVHGAREAGMQGICYRTLEQARTDLQQLLKAV